MHFRGTCIYAVTVHCYQGILRHPKEKSSVSGRTRSGIFLEGRESVIRLDKSLPELQARPEKQIKHLPFQRSVGSV